MNQWWWKVLGIVLIFYTVIVGMLTPLKPGVIDVSPQRIEAGMDVTISVTGYNNHFNEAKENRAYLKVGESSFLPGEPVEIMDHNTIKFQFNIPEVVPSSDSLVRASLTVDNEIDGYSLYPNGVFIKQIPDEDYNHSGVWLDRPDQIHDLSSFRFPYRSILNETIRNTFFHITLWFSMFILLIAGLYYAIKYLTTKKLDYDHRSKSLTVVAILFGVMGIITGSIWARFTWGAWWTPDVKLNMSAVAMLIYLAYLVLRGSIKDQDQEARLASAYNIFAFVALIPLVFVIPRLTDSLHPGNGGNPALGGEDLDNTLRMIFYPSILGLTLIGVWMASLYYRVIKAKEKILLGS
ncbi:MAG: cytochrome c biogenesis protein CcsA [Saprospiraceae bacterium]|nr:cytochrome c biogenesis protein CcsA [Saprospiraceae bacterium]